MHRYIFSLLLVILTTTSAFAVTDTTGPWGIDASKFMNLSTALSSPATAGQTIVVSKPLTINNKTITGNRLVKVINGGRIDPASGKTLRFSATSRFQAGRHVAFAGSGTVAFDKGSAPEIYPEWKGAMPDDATDSTAAINWAIATGIPVKLNAGIYRAATLVFNVNDSALIGVGKYSSKIRTTITNSQNAITIGSTAATTGSRLEDFEIIGNSGTGNAGIQTGTASYYAVGCRLKSLYVHGFTGAGSAGIVHTNAWWFTGTDISFENNYYNGHIPVGAVTTTILYNENTTFRSSLDVGFLVEGNAGTTTADGLTFDHVSFELAVKEAFKSTAAGGNFSFIQSYFEVNSTTGTGTINISGNAAAFGYSRLYIDDCKFHGTTTGYAVLTDYVKASVIQNCDGLVVSGGVLTTANSQLHFRNNRGHTSNTAYEMYATLLGDITGEDVDSATAVYTQYGSKGQYFGSHISSRGTAPGIAVASAAGVGASAKLVRGTDTKGQIQLTTGSSAMSTDLYVTVTFAKAYTTAPFVLLTAGSRAAGQWVASNNVYAVATTTTLKIYFGTAAATGTTGYLNYMVIE